MATREEVIQALRQKGYQGQIPGETQQANQAHGIQPMSAQPQPDIMQLMKQAQGGSGTRGYIADILNAGTTGKMPERQNDNMMNKYLETVLGEQAKSLYRDPLEAQYKQSQIDLNAEKTKLAQAGYVQDEVTGQITKAGKPGLTPGQERQQDTLVEKIYTTREMNEAKKKTTDNALLGAETLPQGWWGKQKIGISKSFPMMKDMLGVTDANIQDAQEMKMALTMGSLAETMHTKGAISDQEMMLFKEASANDDFNSPAVIPVIKKIRAYMDAEEEGLYGAYQQNYGEDPRSWFGEQKQSKQFGSPEEADASGLPAGTIVKTINPATGQLEDYEIG